VSLEPGRGKSSQQVSELGAVAQHDGAQATYARARFERHVDPLAGHETGDDHGHFAVGLDAEHRPRRRASGHAFHVDSGGLDARTRRQGCSLRRREAAEHQVAQLARHEAQAGVGSHELSTH
jgi:hypothetical protein